MGRRYTAIMMAMAVGLAGCDEPDDVYPRPQAEVHALLRTVEVPLYMFGNSADTDVVVDGSDPAKIVWKVTADDYHLMKFTASLATDGEGKTRVLVDVEGSRDGKWGDVEARLRKVTEIRQFYLVSMTEAVDSTLEERAYDLFATYPQMMRATASISNRLYPPDTRSNYPSPPEIGR